MKGLSHTYTLSILPSKLPHNIEQSSICYRAGSCWLSILNIEECMCTLLKNVISLHPVLSYYLIGF